MFPIVRTTHNFKVTEYHSSTCAHISNFIQLLFSEVATHFDLSP